MKATYLLIKSSVLSVTGETKPKEPEKLMLHDHHFEFTVSYRKKWITYDQAIKAFNDSFLKVDNPEVAIRAITAPIQNKVTGLYDDGLYPVDGIEFEVKDDLNSPIRCRGDIGGNGYEKLAVVSLVGAKEKEQSGEPGNEAKKGEVKYWKCWKCGQSVTEQKGAMCLYPMAVRTSGICAGSCTIEITLAEYNKIAGFSDNGSERDIILKFLDWYDGDLGVLKDHNGLVNDYFSERNPLK